MYVHIFMLRRERAKMSLMVGKYSQTEHGIMLTNCSMNALNYLKLHELWNRMNPSFIAFKFKIQCKMWIVLFFAVFVVRYVELSVIWCEIAKLIFLFKPEEYYQFDSIKGDLFYLSIVFVRRQLLYSSMDYICSKHCGSFLHKIKEAIKFHKGYYEIEIEMGDIEPLGCCNILKKCIVTGNNVQSDKSNYIHEWRDTVAVIIDHTTP